MARDEHSLYLVGKFAGERVVAEGIEPRCADGRRQPEFLVGDERFERAALGEVGAAFVVDYDRTERQVRAARDIALGGFECGGVEPRRGDPLTG